MKKYLVIGNPIDHSLSPKLHNYWIAQNKIEGDENTIMGLPIKKIKEYLGNYK